MQRRRLLEGKENAERDFFVSPEISRIAENIEQIFAGFLVELLRIRQLFEYHEKTGLISRLLENMRQTIPQSIIVLAKLPGQLERLCDRDQDLLTSQRLRAIRIEEVLPEPNRFGLQFGNAESPDGLHHIDRNRAQ